MGLLQEYRTRLIADVVTGLAVREAAAHLPDEVWDSLDVARWRNEEADDMAVSSHAEA